MNRTIRFGKYSVVVALCLLAFVAAEAAPGDLDPTFDGDGKVLTSFQNGEGIDAAVVQPDGKIVVAGVSTLFTSTYFDYMAVARYNPNGSLDPTFGNGGKNITTIAGSQVLVFAVALQPDGKIIVGGSGLIGSPVGTNTGYNFVLVRFNANGTVDTSFGASGLVTTDYSGGTTNDDMINALVLQPDGKIVVSGYTRQGNWRDFAAARYNANGTLDTTFDGDGKLITSFSSTSDDEARAVLLQTDGKIIAIGYAPGATGFDFALARYNSDGSLDTTFDGDGKMTTDLGSASDFANAAVIQPDGKFVAGGYSVTGTGSDFAVVRYNANGTLDTNFGANGKTLTDFFGFADRIHDMVLQRNGKIAVAGYTTIPAGSFQQTDFALARYNSNGTIDTGFGTNGKVNTNFSNSITDDRAFAIVLQADGKLVAAGFGSPQANTSSRFALARYIGDAATPRRAKSDFDGDGRTDIAVYRPSNGYWYIIDSATNSFRATNFGISDDYIASADYDGDGKTDIAVYRRAQGYWYIIDSSTNTFRAEQFNSGGGFDIPVPADYDGDGKADLAVFRYGSEPSSPTFYHILPSSTRTPRIVAWGNGFTSVPVPADYDGDGKADIAEYTEAGGNWNILQSSNNSSTSVQFGLGNFRDRPTPADYDGDGKADIAVWRRETGGWYLLRSTEGFIGVHFGQTDDVPVPADYDGDGKADIAVFRSGVWYMLRSSDNSFMGIQFGVQGDTPTPLPSLP